MSLLVATVLLPRALRGVVLPETSRVAEEEQARAWAAEAAIGAIERAQLARLLPTSTSAGVDAGVYAAAASRLIALYRQQIDMDPCKAGAADRRHAADAIDSQLRLVGLRAEREDRKSTRLNSSHSQISYAVFCLKKKKNKNNAFRFIAATVSIHHVT